MKMPNRESLGLRGIILIFVLLAVLATLCNCLFVAYRVQRDALIETTLQNNNAYASKVASSIGEFLRSVQDRLSFSSERLGRQFANQALLDDEVLRLQAQDAELNAALIVDAQGKVLAFSPEVEGLVGSTLTSEVIEQALSQRRPLVSHAYTSATGKLIVFISRPINSPEGKFLGVVGAAVYIQQRGALHTVISNHFHHGGTFAFVADSNRRLLYHPDLARIDELVNSSPTVAAALRGENGVMAAKNYRGIAMLAGYAHVEGANWAVVVQQPEHEALAPLGKLMRSMLIDLVPAGLVGLLLILVGALLITKPLRQLAKVASQLSASETPKALGAIQGWYAEAAAIRRALATGVQLLQQQLGYLNRAAQSDPLTGLANRRAMDAALADFEQLGRFYSVLAFDIDHFKRVNDTFGHDAGDRALQQVASSIQRSSRDIDLACRAGGEEFILLMPDTPLDVAADVAERIRDEIASHPVPGIGVLTISIGVACKGGEAMTSSAILKRADECLYQAKQTGRNKVVSQEARNA